MGFGGISLWQLLIVLAIIVLLFGTKKLRGIGGDLGGAVKGFKKAMSDEKNTDKEKPEQIQKSEESAPLDSAHTMKKIKTITRLVISMGMWELIVVLIVGLVVLGPERLPVAIRTVSRWIKTAKSLANSVKAEVSEELRGTITRKP